MTPIKRLILGFIPNQQCNLKCEYCYITREESWGPAQGPQYSPEHIAKCLSVERLGGVSLINLTGNGETLIHKEIVDLAHLLLADGHYVEVVTNGTISQRINELLDAPKEDLSRLFFKFSFHYKELKRLGIMERFFQNVNLVSKSGASYTVELMAYDGIENEIEDIKSVCLANCGAICQSTIGRDERRRAELLSKHTVEEFRSIWKTLNSPLFDFKIEMLDAKRREFCYAGAWSLFVNLYTGEAQPCYRQPYNQNIFRDPSKKIVFRPVGKGCLEPYCINAHAHLTWGLIPSLRTPSYDAMRNRKAQNGEWLTDSCRSFFSTRLYEGNAPYSKQREMLYSLTNPFRHVLWFLSSKSNFARIKTRLVKVAKWKRQSRKH